MLVNVNGITIDTTKIYQITPVEGDECWKPHKVLSHSEYFFDVYFYDKEDPTTFKINGDEFFKDEDWYRCYVDNPVTYEAKLEEMFNKIETARNELVNYWNQSKTVIPEINF